MSPCRNSSSGPSRRATSSTRSEMSRPCTSKPRAASGIEIRPGPQARSRTRAPGSSCDETNATSCSIRSGSRVTAVWSHSSLSRNDSNQRGSTPTAPSSSPGNSAELLTRELPEAPPRLVVRAHLLLVGVPRICGLLLGDPAQLTHDGVAVPGLAQERIDPRLGAVIVRDVVLDEQLAEQDPHPDVGERADREIPVGGGAD